MDKEWLILYWICCAVIILINTHNIIHNYREIKRLDKEIKQLNKRLGNG